ncbi:class II fructose-bisphosphate aldolase [Caldifermentibacillus hisashii]|jgi:fructose-bisphosphate aldolase class II|uniref:Tagatose 1,6-bisphosphate aldolase n=1 Tax=Caldibacillus thermoamylovorans TaxID=35841 RepID=A0ABD4A2B8_9BACI|nr:MULTISPECIES: class II fructose-bisphosphate aldolase [Bacillaceae]AWI13792.1 ketose-bisphosphate aldolase [Caldibacillus thermoamylovorans]KIO70387.1 Tagatose 1,6-bisphosphate aldolase [Caldibacillus thermoamylovorans]KIO70525.1 Tagatose 1,6-bisphosphate aldolase [Caldibacillus thermoamylovorans]MBU5343918.1 class II fructose-bisphosphate aldolase family protein [Caldifermentibacillus hisashii]MCM3054269.1 class II fructose-bisphosphate aldolase family protein [Caldibacillus thermoamylovor
MYVSMKGMLDRANRGNYAIMAINCFNLETAKAVIEAAQELRAPIIINLLQDHLKEHLGSHLLTEPIIRMANEARVEVAINLDHGSDVGFVKRCLKDGFSSVMMDASGYPIEENIEITKNMVEFAKIFGASVEGEIGHIGSVANNMSNDAMYTDPDLAIDFAQKTGIDALAISYGSSHGSYPEGHVPKFHFEILDKIKKGTNMPLVLHGGSGCGEDNIRKSVERGINKINVGSDFMKAHVDYIYERLKRDPTINYFDLIHQSMDAGRKEVKRYIKLSRSTGKSL